MGQFDRAAIAFSLSRIANCARRFDSCVNVVRNKDAIIRVNSPLVSVRILACKRGVNMHRSYINSVRKKVQSTPAYCLSTRESHNAAADTFFFYFLFFIFL